MSWLEVVGLACLAQWGASFLVGVGIAAGVFLDRKKQEQERADAR